MATSLSEAGIRFSGNSIAYGGTAEASHSEGVIKTSNNGDFRLVWGSPDAPADSPRTKVYDKTAQTWSASATISGGNSTVYWVVNDIAPSGNQEIMATFSSDGSNRYLNVFSWDGASWRKDWDTSSWGSAHETRRGFDLCYSQISGNGIIAYTKNDSKVYYRIHSGGSWGTETEVYASTASTGTIYWIKLVPRPASNEITLLITDSNSDLHAITFDGTTWDEDGSGDSLETGLETTGWMSFDAAYETLSGNLLVAWGATTTMVSVIAPKIQGETLALLQSQLIQMTMSLALSPQIRPSQQSNSHSNV